MSWCRIRKHIGELLPRSFIITEIHYKVGSKTILKTSIKHLFFVKVPYSGFFPCVALRYSQNFLC